MPATGLDPTMQKHIKHDSFPKRALSLWAKTSAYINKYITKHCVPPWKFVWGHMAAQRENN